LLASKSDDIQPMLGEMVSMQGRTKYWANMMEKAAADQQPSCWHYGASL